MGLRAWKDSVRHLAWMESGFLMMAQWELAIMGAKTPNCVRLLCPCTYPEAAPLIILA